MDDYDDDEKEGCVEAQIEMAFWRMLEFGLVLALKKNYVVILINFMRQWKGMKMVAEAFVKTKTRTQVQCLVTEECWLIGWRGFDNHMY